MDYDKECQHCGGVMCETCGECITVGNCECETEPTEGVDEEGQETFF